MGIDHQKMELFLLPFLVDGAEDGPWGTAAVVQSELQQLLGLLHSLAVQHLHGAEIRFGESLKIHLILEQRLDHHVGKSIFSSTTGASTGASLRALVQPYFRP